MPTASRPMPLNRPRWTSDDAREVLTALARSGKSVRVFASEHGLDPQRIYLWRRRLGGAERTTFQELIVRPSWQMATIAPNASFEIVLGSRVVVRVPASFDEAALARLLEVLAKAHAC